MSYLRDFVFRALLALLALVSLPVVAASVQAQTAGFAINRFDVSERGSEWFVGESLDLRGHNRWAAGLVLDYAHKPLVVYDQNGNETAAIVGSQLFSHVGASVVFIDRVRFGLNLPIALVTDGERGTLGTAAVSANTGTNLGDLRLGADVRAVGEYGEAFTLALGLQVHLPTGSREAFTGDGAVRLLPRILVAGELGAFAYSGRVALVYRAQDAAVGGVATGSELLFATTAGVYFLDHTLLVGPELSGSTVLSAAFERETTPFEVLFGGHYTAGDFRFGLGAGPGLTEGLGAPAARVVASLQWAPGIEEIEPEAAPSDRDHDGIVDDDDACPDLPGEASTDLKKNGCPPEGDRDGDGITDDADACPDEPGEASDDPKKHGCPPPKDTDGDGITDDDDACPDEPGEASRDPKKHGCPAPKDTDGDGVLDPDDACPTVAGPPSSDPQKNGCPKARVEAGQIKIIERVEFATDSAKLLSSSDEILNAVLQVFSEHAEITKVSIEGHTDNRGGAAHNKSLSQRRAQSVVKWLQKHGVDKKRLSSKGFGLEKPIDSNDSDDGRQRNRRVEFQIVQIDGEPTK